MKKQHGVVFEAPHCPKCGAEMDLHRWAVGDWTYICELCPMEASSLSGPEYPANFENTPLECFQGWEKR